MCQIIDFTQWYFIGCLNLFCSLASADKNLPSHCWFVCSQWSFAAERANLCVFFASLALGFVRFRSGFDFCVRHKLH